MFTLLNILIQVAAPGGADRPATMPGPALVKLLLGALSVALALLVGLIVLTTIRRAARMKRDAEARRAARPQLSPWEAAGRRARPIDDDPDRTRPLPGTEPLDDRDPPPR